MTDLLLGLFLGVVVGSSLGIIGAGGAILAVPGLVAVLGLDAKVATTASTIIVGSAAAAGFMQRIKSRALDYKIGAGFSLLGVVGTYIGTKLLRYFSDTVLLLLFAVLMFGAAFSMWQRSVTERKEQRTRWWLVILSATAVGLATGLLGVGGGFLIVPALVLFLNIPMKIAAGTSLVAIMLNSTFTFFFRSEYWREVPWAPVLTFAGSAVLASVFTSRFVQRFNPRHLQRGFSVLITVVATYMLVTNFH